MGVERMHNKIEKSIKLKHNLLFSLLILIIVLISVFYPVVSNVQAEDDQLYIIAPTEINEGEQFEVTITDQASNLINNAQVVFSSTVDDIEIYYTNSTGKVLITAPNVEQDKIYNISSKKVGYLSSNEVITILNNETVELDQLIISGPDQVNEGENFQVTITIYDPMGEVSIPINQATVIFNDNYYITNSEGKATLKAPSVDQDTTYMIYVSKLDYEEGSSSIIVREMVSTEPNKQLFINSPSSVLEGNQFSVIITVDSELIENAIVEFNDNQISTPINGTVIFTAPLVDEDTTYVISASHDKYDPATTEITILNRVETQSDYGWIYGEISYDTKKVQGARITFSDGKTVWGTSSDENGRYVKLLKEGTYSVEVSHPSYKTKIRNGIELKKMNAIEVSFILELNDDTLIDHEANDDIIDLAIEWGIDNEIIGAEIIIPQNEQIIRIYDDSISISVDTEDVDNEFIFTVSAPNDSSGKVFALKIDNSNDFLDFKDYDLSKLNIKFDGEIISKATDIDDIFNPSGNTPKWMGIITEKTYVFVYVPEFSEHQITLYFTQEEIVSYTIYAVLVAIIILIIGSLFMFRKSRNNFF